LSLLKEIQDAAVKSNSDLGEILRKCKVLASHLGSKPLEDWLIWESNGYPDKQEVPAYRMWGVTWTGNFSGPFQSAMRNAPISILCFPASIRKTFAEYCCRESIAALEQHVQKSKPGAMLHVTNNDLPLILGDTVYFGYNCIQVSGEFSTGNFIEVINAVRNRILDFALALGKTEPSAIDGTREFPVTAATTVTQIFNTVVYGGEAHVAATAADSRHQTQGDSKVRDIYKTGQAGAVGPAAHAHDMNFNQIWKEHVDSIDLPTLASDLTKLTKALRAKADDPEHQIAIGNVAAAKKAAESGDGPKVLQYLRSAGAWALTVAEEITAKIAVEAITAAMRS
jgi:hypothetical protein